MLHLLWGDIAASIGEGVTLPAPRTSVVAAVGIEALMAGMLMATIFAFVSPRRML